LRCQRRCAAEGVAVWVAALQFGSVTGTISLEPEGSEANAGALVGKLTNALRLPLIDRTVEPPSRVDWHELGKPLVARRGAERASPPPGSQIFLRQASGFYSIVLPAAGIRAEALLLIAFTSIFLFIGDRTLLGLQEAARTGAEHCWTGWLIGGMLSLA